VEVVASLSQGCTAAAQCGLFTHKSVPVIFEPPCIWAHELLLNLIFRLRCDAVFLLPNLGFSMSHLDEKLKLVVVLTVPCVDVVVSGFITCRTVICSLTCRSVVFMVQNFTFYGSNCYTYILKMLNENVIMWKILT